MKVPENVFTGWQFHWAVVQTCQGFLWGRMRKANSNPHKAKRKDGKDKNWGNDEELLDIKTSNWEERYKHDQNSAFMWHRMTRFSAWSACGSHPCSYFHVACCRTDPRSLKVSLSVMTVLTLSAPLGLNNTLASGPQAALPTRRHKPARGVSNPPPLPSRSCTSENSVITAISESVETRRHDGNRSHTNTLNDKSADILYVCYSQ